MVDFRYHLISLIAVFLALGLGILMGSVVVSEATVDVLENRVEDLDGELDARHAQIDEQRQSLGAYERFAESTRPLLLDGVLRNRQIVVVTADNGDGFLGPLRDAVVESGGEVTSVLTLSDRFALVDEEAISTLQGAVGTLTAARGDLRRETALLLGSRMAQAAARDELRGGPVALRLEILLEDLEDGGFLGVESATVADAVPSGALFLLAAGAPEPPEVDVSRMFVMLARNISDPGIAVVVAESRESEWGIVQAVRDDAVASAQASTVDAADQTHGVVAAVLALDRATRGDVGHYGLRADEVIPQPSPSG